MVAVLRKVYGGFKVPAKVATIEASKVEGRVYVYPWTHISHKELIYLLQKST